jgi:alkylation response protein AidB-like acyl-CoA dehydrogenase
LRFELSDEQQLLRSSARDFLAAEMPLEKTRRSMEHDPRGYDAEAWRRFAEMGYLGLVVPESAGGQGLGAVELAIVAEEIGRACAPGPFLEASAAGALLGTAGGHEDLARAVASSEKLVVLARADAAFQGRSQPAARFEKGRVKGRKLFVPFAADADALLVTTGDGICLVEAPFEVVPLRSFDLSQRFGEVLLDHPATRLGPLSLLDRVDLVDATAAAAMLLGLAGRALETTLQYVKTRQAFGRAIGTFQALQHRLADMMLRTESTRSAVYRAAWCLDAGEPDAELACAAAKVYAGDSARVVCGEAIQMHGGIGFTWEMDLHFYLKRVKTLEQFHGSTEDQIARALAAAGY